MAKFLDVFAITSQGQIMHTFRKESNGNWQSFFGDIEQTIKREVAHFTDVSVRKKSAADIDGICLVDNAGKCYYATKRVGQQAVSSNTYIALIGFSVGAGKKTDTWNIITTTNQSIQAKNAKRMLATEHYSFLLFDDNTGKGVIEEFGISGSSKTGSPAVNTQLPLLTQLPSLCDFDACVDQFDDYLFTAAGRDGNIYVVRRKVRNREITLLQPVLSLPNGEKCIRVSCCISVDDLHITAVSQQGNVYHGIFGRQNNFGNIQSVTGHAGSFTDISCADIDGVLHVVGTTTDGRILHTFRRKDGSWQKFFGNIETKTGEAGHFVSVSISARHED